MLYKLVFYKNVSCLAKMHLARWNEVTLFFRIVTLFTHVDPVTGNKIYNNRVTCIIRIRGSKNASGNC